MPGCEVFEKLGVCDHARVCVLHVPTEFEEILLEMINRVEIDQEVDPNRTYNFFLVFVENSSLLQQAVTRLSKRIEAGNATFWFAYPCESSQRYTTDLIDEANWQPLTRLGLKGANRVAIDADWCAVKAMHLTD